LPVGLAVGAADQAPRACDSAHGLTGKERAISRLVAPGSRVTSEPDPTTVSRSAPFIRSEPCVCRRVRGWDLEFESGLLQRRVRRTSNSFSPAFPGALLDDLQLARDLVRLAPARDPPGRRSGSADRNKWAHTNALTSGAVSRRDNVAMGPNSASPSPQRRSDSYGLARRDARGVFVRLFLPG
jgi:hypothetical protein